MLAKHLHSQQHKLWKPQHSHTKYTSEVIITSLQNVKNVNIRIIEGLRTAFAFTVFVYIVKLDLHPLNETPKSY